MATRQAELQLKALLKFFVSSTSREGVYVPAPAVRVFLENGGGALEQVIQVDEHTKQFTMLNHERITSEERLPVSMEVLNRVSVYVARPWQP